MLVEDMTNPKHVIVCFVMITELSGRIINSRLSVFEW